MAQSMKDIKRRIKSVKNIKQITNAMELVSSAEPADKVTFGPEGTFVR